MSGPTQRTLDLLRKHGYTAGVVEKWIPHTRKRLDLFGFIDIVAVKQGLCGVLGVQATSGSNVSARVKKIIALESAREFCQSGNRIEVIGFSKRGKAGKRKTWQPVFRRLSYLDCNWCVETDSELTITAIEPN